MFFISLGNHTKNKNPNAYRVCIFIYLTYKLIKGEKRKLKNDKVTLYL